MTNLYVKTILAVPGQAPITHVAELEPIDSHMCRPVRMLELGKDDVVAGAYRRNPRVIENFSAPPQDKIPHPDHWQNLDDIYATLLNQAEFEQLWLEAEQKFETLK